MSTPASATAERPGPPRPGARISLLQHLLRTPAGAVGLVLTVGVVVVAVFADAIAPFDPFVEAGPSLGPPSSANRMGTDQFRRDVLSGVIHGARTSLTIVLWVVAISTVIGLIVGAVAGYVGGLVDDVLMRIIEIIQSAPRFLLAVLMVGLYGPGIDKLILMLGLLSWTFLARMVRAEVLSLRERDFVEAARAYGASGPRILLRHVLPNTASVATVVVTLMASRIILIEAGLAFLGLGDQNQMSWGLLINNAQQFLDFAWWLSVFPGLAIALTVLGLNLLGDAVNQVLDPQGAPSRVRAWRGGRSGAPAPDLA